MKGPYTLALFCVALALMSVTVSASKRDLTVGYRVQGDRLLDQQQVNLKGYPLIVRDKEVTLQGDGYSKINSVEIFDLKGNKHSATPSILSGGPGFSFVTVGFTSERGHGIHYLVKVYGK